MKIEFSGRVTTSGNLIINKQQFINELLHFCDSDVTITLEKKKNKRSVPQNRYYYGVAIPICRDGIKSLGHSLTREETHQFLAARFLRDEIIGTDGIVLGEKIRSTTSLSKAEFIDYIGKIQQFCSEYLNVILPDPNTQMTIV